MRNFLLISILIFSVACNTNPYKSLSSIKTVELTENEVYNPFDTDKSLLFKTKVNVYKHYLSGLLVIKKKEESKRVVFTSEMGIKFFDFEFTKDTFVVHYCMEKLNQKAVLQTLEEDIGMAIHHNIVPSSYELLSENTRLYRKFENNQFYVYSLNEDNKIEKIENTTNKKQKVVITFEDYKEDVPKLIKIHHHDIKLDIELNYIKR